MPDAILPPSTIGMIGGGQLGKMFAQEAKRMGYRVMSIDPTAESPISTLVDEHIVAPYDDPKALKKLAEHCEVITYEFENVNAAMLEELEKKIPVHPNPRALAITQHRVKEKEFARECSVATTDFLAVNCLPDLENALQTIGLPALLKTCRLGYDGKGQRVVHTPEEARQAFVDLGASDLIWERFVPFEKEISVVSVRSHSGEFRAYPLCENVHKNNILDTTVAPAAVTDAQHMAVVAMTQRVLDGLQIVGTCTVEYFLKTTGEWLMNEIAPRPHNSGHYTIEGCIVNQFEHQLRAICGLPLGSTELLRPAAAMKNILGQATGDTLMGIEEALLDPRVRLHLYGKQGAKLGRKMGHITALADSTDEALKIVNEAYSKLSWK